MMIMRGVTAGLAALAAGLVIVQVLGPILIGQGAALAADAARGKVLFTQKYGCYECHGTQGQGSPVTGPKLAPNPLPYDTLSAFVRTSNGPMPPFRESILPNADLEDIYAYLQSIKPAADYRTIPLLNNK
jgi:mono/diheme cytochrome c family protein